MPVTTTGTATPSVRTPIAARLGAIPSFTFDATPTDPQDGEDVTFSVPDDGNGDIYTVEVIDVDTGVVFTTLSWTGSQFEGTVTINGTDGDSFTFEAKKTRDQDGATKRSGNQETVQITAAYESETNSFETRVNNDGGTLHDKDFVDSLISQAKTDGWYSDIVRMAGPALAYKESGGTLPTLYDASGQQNDWVQATSSEQPVLNSSNGTFNSRPTAGFDGTDDYMEDSTSTQTKEIIAVAEWTGTTTFGYLIKSPNVDLSVRHESNAYRSLADAGSGDFQDSGDIEVNGQSSDLSVDRKHVVWMLSDAQEPMDLLGKSISSFDRWWEGPIALAINISSTTTATQRDNLISVIENYYNITI
jgi:hypothetical protein